MASAKSSPPVIGGAVTRVAAPPVGAPAAAEAARPSEIELASNRLLIHPLSARLARRLASTPATPNQVSVAGAATAGVAAAGILALPWPWTAAWALMFLFAWHVLDGADGDLARLTGRASPIGELIDGVCDHAAQGLVYVALALVVQRQIGLAAWPLALLSAACHFVQANAYESWRKTYRRFGHGAAWMRQTFAAPKDTADPGVLGRFAGGVYLALANLFLAGEPAIERAITLGGAGMRERYRAAYAPLVRASAWLSSNARTLALFVCLLIRWPAGFFAFEIVALSAILAILTLVRRRRDRRFLAIPQAI